MFEYLHFSNKINHKIRNKSGYQDEKQLPLKISLKALKIDEEEDHICSGSEPTKV